jgi:hypothetical protein
VPPAPVPPASLAEAVGEAGAAEAKLRQIEAALAPDAAFEGLASQLTEQLVSLEDRAAEAHERIERATRMRQLDDLEGRWLSEQTALEGLRKETTERARTIAESLAQVEALSEVWEKTRMQAREALAPAAVSDRIARTLRAARATREKITAYRDEVLALQAEIAGGLGTVSDVLEQTQRAEQVMRGGLFGTDSLPIWTALIRHRDFGETLESAVTAFEHDLVAARDFALGQETRLAVHGVLLLLLVAVALSMRRRAERWASEDEAGAPAARLLVRPYAAAVVVAVIVTPFFYYKPPTYFGACVLLAGLAATLRLIPPLLERGVRPACYALAGFFVLDLVRDGLVGVPLLARLVFLVQMAGAVAVFVWLLNPRRLALLPNSDRRMPLFVFVKRLAIALLAAAIVGSILGYVALSRLVGSGVLRSAYAGVIIYVAYKVLSGMLVVSLRARALQYLNLIRDHRQRTARRLTGLTRFAALAFWLYLSLGYFSVRDPLLAAVSAFLTAPLAVGELEISLGDILALALALIVSVYLSRFVRYVLDEDVLPRLALPRGVPYAISTSAFYVVLMFGVFASLAAAGIDLSPLRAARRCAGRRHRLRSPERREQLRLGPDPALRAADQDRGHDRGGRADGRGSPHRDPLEHRAHLGGRRGHRAQREPGLRPGDQLDAVGPPAPHQRRGGGQVRDRPGARAGAVAGDRRSQRPDPGAAGADRPVPRLRRQLARLPAAGLDGAYGQLGPDPQRPDGGREPRPGRGGHRDSLSAARPPPAQRRCGRGPGAPGGGSPGGAGERPGVGRRLVGSG